MLYIQEVTCICMYCLYCMHKLVCCAHYVTVHLSNLHRKRMGDSQVKVVKENANKIAKLIKGNLTIIANDLQHVKLLTDQDYDEIVNAPAIPPLQRANTLIQRVIAQVEVDPAQYEIFRGVLEKHLNPEVLRKILPKLDGESVLYCTVCSYSGVLRTGSRMVPHGTQRWSFVNNSASMPLIGYVTSILFKFPGPNMPPHFWDHMIYCLWNWVAIDAFAERQLLYRQAMAFVLPCRRDLMVT